MSAKARTYISVSLLLGLGCLVWAGLNFKLDDPLRFLTFAIITAVTAGLKVKLPGITGTLSANDVFLFFCIIELSPSEAIFIATLAAIVQTIWNAKARVQPVHLSFNASSMALSMAATCLAYQAWPPNSPLLLKLAFAAPTYFLVNTLSVSVIIALTEKQQVMAVWRESYFWSFPYYLVGASAAASMAAAARFLGWEVGLGVAPLLFVVYRSYSMHLGQLEKERQHAERIASLHLRTIEALALAIEAKDQTTGEHLQRVQAYALGMATELGLGEQELLAVQAASILHDIGKLAVPDYIISKPGRLTPEEFEKMKVHPVVGAEILERVNFPYPVVPIVRAHHEKWDGSGYPNGLKGTEIPIGARILSAVDCLDALASDRQYRKALPLKEAMNIVSGESGKAFDPQIVAILELRYEEFERLARLKPMSEPLHLSTDVKIERGKSPDAGFEMSEHVNPGEGQALVSLARRAAACQAAQSLHGSTQDLGNSLSLSETLSVIASRIKTLVPYEAVAIYMSTGDILEPRYVTGQNQNLFEALRIPIGSGLSGWVAENGKPIVNGNPSVEPGYLNDPSRFSTLRSALAVPLRTELGTFGVISLYRSEKDAFSRDDLRALLVFTSKISIAIEDYLSHRAAGGEAPAGDTTRLPVASALFLNLDNELVNCVRNNTAVAVLVCDLDGFERINDEYGRNAGDEVVRRLVDGFGVNCRDSGYVARMGSDEFALVLPCLSVESIEQRVADVKTLIRESGIDVCGEGLTASLGMAMYPEDGADAESLLDEANRRMYRIKRMRRENRRATAAQRDLMQLTTSLASPATNNQAESAALDPTHRR